MNTCIMLLKSKEGKTEMCKVIRTRMSEYNKGLFQKKIHTPTTEGMVFWAPPIHLDFQNCLSPPPLKISEFKDPPPHPSGFP